jgi:phage shock protein PspC (stress-responsive transcriptional regulator)
MENTMSRLPAKRERGELAERDPNALYRDLERKKIAGVCSGLAKWSRVPTAIWRLGFVLTTLLWGLGIPAYAIMWFVMDEPPKGLKPEPKPNDLDADDREIWDAVKGEMASLDLEND